MRFRVTLTVVCEYDFDPSDYPGSDVDAMLAIDRDMIDDDPSILLDNAEIDWEVMVETVDATNYRCASTYDKGENSS